MRDSMFDMISSRSLRDYEDEFKESDLYEVLEETRRIEFDSGSEERVLKAYENFTLFLSFPEVEVDVAYDVLVKKRGVVRTLCRRFVEGSEEETSRICKALVLIYRRLETSRPLIRNEIAMILEELIESSMSTAPIHKRKTAKTLASCANDLLRDICLPVIRGFSRGKTTRKSHNSLLDILLRLHYADTMVNEITPTLQLYHESLVCAILAFLSVFSSELSRVVKFVSKCYPTSRAANTPKSVLILHELERLSELSPNVDYFNREIRDVVTPILLRGMSSDNSRIAQRSLQFFRNDELRIFYFSCDDAVSRLLECLLRKGQKHWNPTVNRMTAAVLRYIRDDSWKESFNDIVTLERLSVWILTLDPVPLEEKEEEIVDNMKKEDSDGIEKRKVDEYTFYDFVWGHELGTGSFSKVKFAKLIDKTKMPSKWKCFAVKIVDQVLYSQDEIHKMIQREESLLLSTTHENIVNLNSVFTFRGSRYLCLQYCKEGDLFSVIQRHGGKLHLESARFCTAEILSALQYLHHRCNIVYADLKPENVMITESGHALLGDFGAARRRNVVKSSDDRCRLEGTAAYFSPEVLRTRRLTFASDLWALGLVTFQMLGGRLPDWPSTSSSDVSSEQTKQDRDTVAILASEHRPDEVLAKVVSFATMKPTFPFGFDDSARNFVESLLQIEPSKRLGVKNPQSLHNHVFFENLKFDSLNNLTITPLAKSLSSLSSSRGGSAVVKKSWSRRRNSIMWTPMPTRYEFNSDDMSKANVIFEGDVELDHCWNGEGHDAVYSSRGVSTTTTTTRNKVGVGRRRRRFVSKRPNFAPKGCRGFVDFAG